MDKEVINEGVQLIYNNLFKKKELFTKIPESQPGCGWK
jgi:hypothetical protein